MGAPLPPPGGLKINALCYIVKSCSSLYKVYGPIISLLKFLLFSSSDGPSSMADLEANLARTMNDLAQNAKDLEVQFLTYSKLRAFFLNFGF